MIATGPQGTNTFYTDIIPFWATAVQVVQISPTINFDCTTIFTAKEVFLSVNPKKYHIILVCYV